MLILGILSLIAGIVVFRFVANGQSKSFLDRPMLFNNSAIVLVLHLMWLFFIGLGLYFLWSVNSTIVLVIIGIYALLWVAGYITNSKKSKAKKIFKIYKQVKVFKPELDTISQYKLVATSYYESLRWNERRIQMTVETIFEDKKSDEMDVKDMARSILNFEDPSYTFGQDFSFERYIKQSSKEQKAIDTAYIQVIGNKAPVTERPELSAQSLQCLKSTGLNPDEMSNEQLQVFTEIDDHSQSSWIVKGLYSIAGAGLLLAIISLLFLDLWGVGIWLTSSFVLWFIGNKLQMRRISKKFHEASIAKYASERSKLKEE